MKKETFKVLVSTRITTFNEKELRFLAKDNSKMVNFNVSISGPHPALNYAVTPHDVRKMRMHVKMLLGDFLTFETRALQSGGSPHCRICPSPAPSENLTHVLILCVATSEIRSRFLLELESTLELTKTKIDFQNIIKNPMIFEQFVLDSTSMNLDNYMRIHIEDPALMNVTKTCRDMCHAIGTERNRRLKLLKDLSP